MSAAIDLTGQQFGHLTALIRNGQRWLCQCDCGKKKSIQTTHLRSGATRSCGHLIGEATRKRCTKHGRKPRGGNRQDPTYSTWCGMWTRCTNPNQRTWANYGGRGIKVCDRWKDFQLFLADMGERPEGSTLDRIDNDGDYCPGNCQWQTLARQSRNKRNTLSLTYAGRTQPLADWAEERGMVYATLYNRLHVYGWTAERALSTPVK